MVPFSFPQTRLKSRVMQKYTSSFLVAHGVWNQVLLPFPAFLLSLWSFRPVREIIEKPNESAKIQVNPTKSNQIKPLFLFITSPNRVQHAEGQMGGTACHPSPDMRCHGKIPMNQILFQEPSRRTALVIFYPCPPVSIWFKKLVRFQVI